MPWPSHWPYNPRAHLTEPAALERARRDFLERRPRNLTFLLRKRYEWMNAYLDGKEAVVDLGAGMGLSREFLANPRVQLTDVRAYPWIDRRVDALALPYTDSSIDAFVCSHVIHHLARPVDFLRGLARRLKPGGLILVQELELSLLLKALMALRGIEGWDETVDPFDDGVRCTRDGADPWSANCAVPRLLLSRPRQLEEETGLVVERDELVECLIFPLSGGVLAKSPSPPLPEAALRAVDRLDALLIGLAPGLFALGRRAVLRRP